MSDKIQHPRILPPETPNRIKEAEPKPHNKKIKYKGSFPKPKYNHYQHHHGNYQSQRKKTKSKDWRDRGRLDPNRVSFVNPNFDPDAVADEVVEYEDEDEYDEVEEVGDVVEYADEQEDVEDFAQDYEVHRPAKRKKYYTTRRYDEKTFRPQQNTTYSGMNYERSRDSHRRRDEFNYDYNPYEYQQSSSSSGRRVQQSSSSSHHRSSASPHFGTHSSRPYDRDQKSWNQYLDHRMCTSTENLNAYLDSHEASDKPDIDSKRRRQYVDLDNPEVTPEMEDEQMDHDGRRSPTPSIRPVTGFSCQFHDKCCTPPPELPKYEPEYYHGNPTYESYLKIGLGWFPKNHPSRRPYDELTKYLKKHPKKFSPDFDSLDVFDKYYPNWRTEKRKPRSRSRSRTRSPTSNC